MEIFQTPTTVFIHRNTGKSVEKLQVSELSCKELHSEKNRHKRKVEKKEELIAQFDQQLEVKQTKLSDLLIQFNQLKSQMYQLGDEMKIIGEKKEKESHNLLIFKKIIEDIEKQEQILCKEQVKEEGFEWVLKQLEECQTSEEGNLTFFDELVAQGKIGNKLCI